MTITHLKGHPNFPGAKDLMKLFRGSTPTRSYCWHELFEVNHMCVWSWSTYGKYTTKVLTKRWRDWHNEAETKGPPFSSRHFEIRFRVWKTLYFDCDFTEICTWRSNWQYLSINLGEDLAPNRPPSHNLYHRWPKCLAWRLTSSMWTI